MARREWKNHKPGAYFPLEWFPGEPLIIDPQNLDDTYFANALLNMEERAFSQVGMPMPRWVFYDCAIMPGIVSGFAFRTSELPASIEDVLGRENLKSEWTPISMFIAIPTMLKSEWVAHNLSSINSVIPEQDRFYGLGFLSKAFGLAYGNIEICCGMTQWGAPALKLHSNYGEIEIVTAYTPVHTYANTITYRMRVNPDQWSRFFTKKESPEFNQKFVETGLHIDTTDEKSQIELHRRIERGEGPYYLSGQEIRNKPLKTQLKVYVPRAKT